MDKKQQKLIERFIDGEKLLFSRIKTIDINDDESLHAKYLKALLDDDMPTMMTVKREIVVSMKSSKDKKPKPKFNKKEK